jgi:predicted RNase H-like HicB family nuclease
MATDVSGYSYFLERRESDKVWIATVTEFPGLTAESKGRMRALNELQDAVRETVLRRFHAGEPFPAPPNKPQTLLRAFGLE